MTLNAFHDVVDLHLQVLQDGNRHALPLADEAEQNVLRPHILMAKTRGFLAGQREHLSHTLSKVVPVHGCLALLLVLCQWIRPSKSGTAEGRNNC